MCLYVYIFDIVRGPTLKAWWKRCCFSCDLNDDSVSGHLIAYGSSFHKAGAATEKTRLSCVSNLVLSTVDNAWEEKSPWRDGWWLRIRVDRYWSAVYLLWSDTSALKVFFNSLMHRQTMQLFQNRRARIIFSGTCDSSCNLWITVDGRPYSRELPLSNLDVTNAWTSCLAASAACNIFAYVTYPLQMSGTRVSHISNVGRLSELMIVFIKSNSVRLG